MTVAGELSVIGRACHWCQLVTRRDTQPPPFPPPRTYPIHIITRLSLAITDHYSRFYEVDVMLSTTTKKIIDCLADAFRRLGLPNAIKSITSMMFYQLVR